MAQALAKNLNKLGCRNKKGGLSATKQAIGKESRANLAKRKRNRAIGSNKQIMSYGRGKVSEGRTLVRKRGVRAEAWSRKSKLPAARGRVTRRGGKASKESVFTRSERQHELVNGRKSSSRGSGESCFHSKSG